MPLTLSLNLNDHSGAAIDMLKAAQHPAASSLIAKLHSKSVVGASKSVVGASKSVVRASKSVVGASKPKPSAVVTKTARRGLAGPLRM